MRAIVHDRYGPADRLGLRDLGEPPIEAAGGRQARNSRTAGDAVRIRVRAAGVHRGDALAVEGLPYAARLAYGLRRPKRLVPGTDVAGVVTAVGSAVTRLQPGDEVFGWAHGAFADHAVAAAGMLVPKPATVTFEQAAATPTPAVAALQALRDVGRLAPGQDVLVLGASGGVGTFAVQIAAALGARVTGTSSTRNLELVRSVGADHVLDYTREDLGRWASRFDVVVDLAGREPLHRSRRLLRPNGRYVVVGGDNPRSLTGMGRFVRALALSPWVRQSLRPLFSTPSPADLESVAGWLATGQVLPVLDATYDLRDAAEAIRHVQTGHSRGRVVITV